MGLSKMLLAQVTFRHSSSYAQKGTVHVRFISLPSSIRSPFRGSSPQDGQRQIYNIFMLPNPSTGGAKRPGQTLPGHKLGPLLGVGGSMSVVNYLLRHILSPVILTCKSLFGESLSWIFGSKIATVKTVN
jgi:hypothetical protein